MRQFVSREFPDERGLLVARENDWRHLRKVLRARPGDMIRVRLPDSSQAGATVCKIDDAARSVTMQLCAESRGESQARAEKIGCSLFQFIARPQKMEIIAREAVECGASEIIPVIGEFSQKSSVDAFLSRRARIERVVKEAMEQSGAPFPVAIREPVSASGAAALWTRETQALAPSESFAIMLSEREAPPAFGNGAKACAKKTAVAVGCEGGVSESELETFSGAGFVPVHFNCNIMRCETAVVYGIAALQTIASFKDTLI